MFCIALAIPGCGGGSPTSVATGFLNALIAHDSRTSFALLSDQFKHEYGLTEKSWNEIVLVNPIPDNATYTVRGVETEGDSAVVTIVARGEKEQDVELVRESGKWKVDYQIGRWYGLYETPK